MPGVGGKGINIPSIPRLEVGMDYVPFDDFPALLHKGERVLTADEPPVQLWRWVTINMNGPVNVRNDSDIRSREELYRLERRLSPDGNGGEYVDQLLRKDVK